MLSLLLCLAFQDLNADTYEKIRDHVVPAKDELKWLDIGWRPSVWDALVEAQKDDKPILIWAMNGHPLACV
jgi:hypothetical protein